MKKFSHEWRKFLFLSHQGLHSLGIVQAGLRRMQVKIHTKLIYLLSFVSKLSKQKRTI